MSLKAKIEIDGKFYEYPITIGSESEKAIDISKLRADTGCITIDHGFLNTGSCASAITFLDGDITSYNFPPGNYSYIIHAATETTHDSYDTTPLLAFDKISLGTHRVLEFACQANTQNFLYVSSGAVYGIQPPDMPIIPEDYAGAPDVSGEYAAYSEGKRVSEMLCHMYARKHSFDIKIARCFAFIGPYMPLDQHLAIGNFIRDALHAGPIRVKGDGTPYRSYMYTNDLVIWLWTILFRGENCRPYNVGSDEALQIKDVAQYVANEVSGGTDVIVEGYPDLFRPVDRFVPDVSRARNELGLTIETSFTNAVRQTIQWYSKTDVASQVEYPVEHDLGALDE